MEIKGGFDQLRAKTGPLSPTTPLPKTQDTQTQEFHAAVVPAASQDASAVKAGPRSEFDLASMSQADTLKKVQTFVAGNPQAAQDLEKLQEEGKLTPEVLASLNQLLQQPLAEGIDRASLINSALRNLADPTSITQGGRQTCAATTVEIMLAKENPAEFLRLVAGLASPEGKVTLSNGDTIQRDQNWNNNPNRSVIDNLMQPAFMQYATGGYDNVSDTRLDGQGQGMYADEEAKLTKAATGKDVGVVFGNSPEIMDQISQATSTGKSVSAIIKGTDANGKEWDHSVVIEGVKDGNVTFIDPNGKRMTLPAGDFQKLLDSVNLSVDLITPQQKKDAAVHNRGPLAGCGGIVGSIVGGIKDAVGGVVDAVKDVGKAINNVVCDTFQQVNKMMMSTIAAGLDLVGAHGLADKTRELQKDLDKAIDRTRDLLEASMEAAAKLTKGLVEVMANPTDLSGAVSYLKSSIKEVGKLAMQAFATLEAFPGMKQVFKFLASDTGKKLMLVVSLVLTVCTFGAAAPLVALIGPGVIAAANMVMAGVAVYNGVKGLAAGMATGNLKMAAQGVASAVMGYYGASGPAAGSLGSKVLTGVKVATAVDGAAEAYKKGDITGAVMGLGSAYMASGGSGTTEIGGGVTVGQALNTAKAVHNKDYGAAVGAIAGAAGASSSTAQNLVTATNVIHAIDQHNYTGAVAAIGGGIGGTTGETLNTLANTANAIEQKDYAQALGFVAGATESETLANAAYALDGFQNQDFGAAAMGLAMAGGAANETAQDLGTTAELLNALSNGNYTDALRELGQAFGGTTGETLATAAETAQAIEEKDYAQALGLVAGASDSETLDKAAAIVNGGNYGALGRSMLEATGLSKETLQNIGIAAGAAYVVSSDNPTETLNSLGQRVGGKTGEHLTTAANLGQAIEDKNYARALGFVAGATDSETLANTAYAVDGFQNHDFGSAARGLAMAGGASNGTTQNVTNMANLAQDIANNNYLGALQQVAQGVGGTVGNVVNTAQAIQNRDLTAVGQAIGGSVGKTVTTAGQLTQDVKNRDRNKAKTDAQQLLADIKDLLTPMDEPVIL